MKRVFPWVFGIAFLVLLVVAVVSLTRIGKPIVAPENQKTADSLETTLPEHERRLDSLQRAKDRADSLRMAVVERKQAAKERSAVSAARARELAEKARQASNARDSAELWRMAFHAERERGDSLEAALNHANREIEQLDIRVAAADSAFELEHSRRLALQDLNRRILEDVRKAEHRSKALGFIPLPTKGEVVGTTFGLVSGYLAGKSS